MRKSAQTDNKSLKMFFVFSGVVLFFVLISLLIKVIFVIQQSKFDRKHQFVLSLYQDSKIKEIIKFSPQENKTFVLDVTKNNIEIIPDAKVDYRFDLQLGPDVAKTMRDIVFRYNSVSTNLTIFDLVRLTILSHKASVEKIDSFTTVNFFLDESIVSENTTIQIINGSAVAGEGKKLEDALNNLGFNVISVTTSREEEKFSKVQYTGIESYTARKLKNILGFNLEKTDKAGIADIIVIIGKNK